MGRHKQKKKEELKVNKVAKKSLDENLIMLGDSLRECDRSAALSCIDAIIDLQLPPFDTCVTTLNWIKNVTDESTSSDAIKDIGLECVGHVFKRYGEDALNHAMIKNAASLFVPCCMSGGNLKWLMAFIEHGKINSLWFDNVDPMERAIVSSSEDMVSYVIKEGGDPNGGSDPNWHTALCKSRYQVLPALFAGGADIHARNSFGDTALHIWLDFCAPRSKSDEKDKEWGIEVLDFLFENGANAQALNIEGLTPIEVAIERKLDIAADLINQRHAHREARMIDQNTASFSSCAAKPRARL